jgi:transposase
VEGEAMMRERRLPQGSQFYEFRLEEHVPADHLVRAIRFVDLAGIRHLAPFYSAIGRPSIDPELMIRMLIVGYCSAAHPSPARLGRSVPPLRCLRSADAHDQ